MATIKSYSDLQQSKKLAEILPLESADMFHFIHEVDNVGFGYKKDAAEFYSKTEFEYIPCWSLAALLDILPNDTSLLYFDDAYQMVYDKKPYVISNKFDNPVDACYELILKLNELKML